MLRPAIDATVSAFERREGVVVDRIYNGCGILVAQMNAAERGVGPDAYFSCDQSFLDQVQERFEPGLTLTENDIIILVAMGNPQHVTGLDSLTRDGLRVGVGHPEKSALGALTGELLRREGRHAELSERIAVESATGDLLVNQLRAGALDAILVYRSNAALVLDHCEVVELDAGLRRSQGAAEEAQGTATASQPYAVCHHSNGSASLCVPQMRYAGSRQRSRVR